MGFIFGIILILIIAAYAKSVFTFILGFAIIIGLIGAYIYLLIEFTWLTIALTAFIFLCIWLHKKSIYDKFDEIFKSEDIEKIIEAISPLDNSKKNEIFGIYKTRLVDFGYSEKYISNVFKSIICYEFMNFAYENNIATDSSASIIIDKQNFNKNFSKNYGKYIKTITTSYINNFLNKEGIYLTEPEKTGIISISQENSDDSSSPEIELDD